MLELVSALESDHHPYVRKLDVWQRLYDATPLHAVRSSPFPYASNIVAPIVRIHSDALSSRLFNSTLATKDVWTTTRSNSALADGPKRWIEFVNASCHGLEYDIDRPVLAGYRELVPMGDCVWQSGWGVKTQAFPDPTSIRPGRTPRIQRVVTHNGPTFDHVPRRQIMWQPGRSLLDAEYVVKQSAMTWTEIAYLTQPPGIWDKDAVNKIRGKSSIYTNDPAMRMGHSSLGTYTTSNASQIDAHALYDIREIWINLPVLQGFGLEGLFSNDDISRFLSPSVVIHMHRDTGEILSVIAKPYAIRGWPFHHVSFRGEGGTGQDPGAARLLEHMQAGASTMMNQAIDAVTIANSIFMITNDRDLLDKTLAPNKPLFSQDPSDQSVRIVQLPKLIQPDLALVTTLLSLAERVVPAFDREGRSGGHPSPATSTLTLLNESKETLRTTLKMARSRLSEVPSVHLVLYQQFLSPDEWLERVGRVIGIEDAAEAARYALPDNESVGPRVGADLRALTEDLNPESARQRAVLVDQATSNFYSRLIQLSELLVKTGGPKSPFAPMVSKFARATGEAYKDLLESVDVDDLERYLYDFANGQAPDPNAVRADAAQRGVPGVGAPGAPPAVPPDFAGFARESGNAPVVGAGEVA